MIVFFDIGNCLYDPYSTFRRTIEMLGHGDLAERMLAENGTYPDQPGRHDAMLTAFGLSDDEVEAYFREFTRHPVFHPGIPELLAELRARGVQIGVISDGHFDTQVSKLETWGLLQYIDANMVFIGSLPEDRGRAPGVYPKGTQLEGSKRDVATFRNIFKSITERMDIEPGQCLMVGDDYIRDALHPIAAGWKGVWFVPNPQAANTMPDDEEASQVPTIVNLNELKSFLSFEGEPSEGA